MGSLCVSERNFPEKLQLASTTDLCETKTCAFEHEGQVVKLDQKSVAMVDKSKFDTWLHLHALRVPKRFSQQAAKILSKHVLDKPRIKHIVEDPTDQALRRVILSEGIGPGDLPENKLIELKKFMEIDIVPHDVQLDYSYWPVEHILKDILPAGCEVPSAFECIGHIAHLNLRDELLPYRDVIAQVFLDKNHPKIKTVVNKVGTISNEFRVPEFEVLAGTKSLVTEVKQHGATFRLDYGLVYWNSRLEFEHKRLASLFQSGQVVCDMFAGIGPFAIPAAQRGCIVYANDLNPSSVEYLRVNAKLNKVEGRVHSYNMDARQFVRHLLRSTEEVHSSENCSIHEHEVDNQSDEHVKDGCGPLSVAENVTPSFESLANSTGTAGLTADLVASSIKSEATKQQKDKGTSSDKRRKKGKSTTPFMQDTSICEPWKHFDHVVMNLPASALEFLDVFKGLLSARHWKGSLPRVHCYCFKRSNQTEADVIEHAETILQGPLLQVSVWTVRDVAPNKTMLCISFDLPEKVAFAEEAQPDLPYDQTLSCPGLLKRPRTGS